ncbi:MAG: hypothetical protein H6842_07800 [Rhodospirillaceae bacterium]|nr:hypothetical protein [Rhodospirillaceae bacterium]
MNPEFVRNLRLECSAHRMIAMPLILGLLIAVGWMSGSMESAAATANTAIGILLVLWGTRLAADSVLGEVVDRTWDSQRMSAIGPWAMTWGKLFGSTVYVWYGALACLPLAVIAGATQAAGDDFLPARLYASGLLGQATAMFLSLLLLRGRPQRLRLRVTLTQALAIVATLPFIIGAVLYSEPSRASDHLSWYGVDIPTFDFLFASCLVFVAWAVFGCYRLMRLELQCRTGLVGWLAFSVFLPAYLAGIHIVVGRAGLPLPAGRLGAQVFVAFMTALALTYFAAFTEPKGVTHLRGWLHDLGARAFGRATTRTPSWVVSGIVCLGCAGATVAAFLYGGSRDAMGFAVFTAALLLFAVRDIALLHALTLDSQRQRGHLAALVYLAVLYILIPAFLHAADADEVVQAFVPTLDGNPVASTVPVAVQALAALGLAAGKWRRLAHRAPGPQPRGAAA